MHLFGKAKKQTDGTTAKDSITKLRETLDMLEKRERYLQAKMDAEVKTAKMHLQKGPSGKRMAVMALSRKKIYEQQVDKILGARMTLETQVMTIENANVNLEAMKAMKTGASAMKNIHGAMDINQVDNTMDDIREQMDLANEISDAISQPVGMGLDIDEDELAKELEDLEQEELDSKLLDVEPAVSLDLPAAATGKLPERKAAAPSAKQKEPALSDEDAEFEALRQAMAS